MDKRSQLCSFKTKILLVLFWTYVVMIVFFNLFFSVRVHALHIKWFLRILRRRLRTLQQKTINDLKLHKLPVVQLNARYTTFNICGHHWIAHWGNRNRNYIIIVRDERRLMKLNPKKGVLSVRARWCSHFHYVLEAKTTKSLIRVAGRNWNEEIILVFITFVLWRQPHRLIDLIFNLCRTRDVVCACLNIYISMIQYLCFA